MRTILGWLRDAGRRTVLTLTALVALTACTGQSTERPLEARTPAPAVALPLERLRWDEADARLLFLARQRVFLDCVRDAGFVDYPAEVWV